MSDFLVAFLADLPATILAITTIELFLKPLILHRSKTRWGPFLAKLLLGEKLGTRALQKLEDITGEDWNRKPNG